MTADKTTNSEATSDLERILREAEASSFAEGINPQNDLEYQDLKAKLIAGEITTDEAVELYIERTKPRVA